MLKDLKIKFKIKFFKRNGKGKMTWKDGTVYNGDFEDDLLHVKKFEIIYLKTIQSKLVWFRALSHYEFLHTISRVKNITIICVFSHIFLLAKVSSQKKTQFKVCRVFMSLLWLAVNWQK
jgi:hypothetical protein